jgi:hypothetical protein
MSDKTQKLTIVLDQEYGDESLKPLIATLKMVRGVADVIPGEPTNWSDHAARATVMQDYINDMYTIMSLQGALRSKETDQAWAQIQQILGTVRKTRGY